MTRKVTLKSLAKDLGISHMTVSRAMNNHPSVSDKIREKVLSRANELGYVRSNAANAIRGLKTGTIGLLLPNIVNEFYAHYADTLTKLCEQSRRNLVIHLTDDDEDKEFEAITRLQEIHADIVIMVPCHRKTDMRPLSFPPLRVLQLIRSREEPIETSSIAVADSQAITDAVSHLVSKGHSKIAYVGTAGQLSSGRGRLSAFTQAMMKFDCPIREKFLSTGLPGYQLGEMSVQNWLNADDKPTAIICGGFEITRGALESVMRSGIAIPEHLAFVGYGDPSLFKWINGGISTISLPIKSLAKATYEAIIKPAPQWTSHVEQEAIFIPRATS